ncbi:hypothetical protein ACHRVZ_04265 [Flavobacterium sp. FlaQc-57]|uniref:hypothetical protein n=1 Tax=Flavobacterium sp. FlaQc-57 TaxID=3374186 RepID=UPI003756CC01
MKKVILSISAMLFVSAFGTAQILPGTIAPNTSYVNQTGSSQDAFVHQIGTAQSSSVKQMNWDNTSQVFQGVNPGQMTVLGVNISHDNLAEVVQNGEQNIAYISQNNWRNKAYQTQVGNKNDATIWQDETNVSYGLFTGNLKGEDKATQKQTGNSNKATIDQGTSGNTLPTAAVFTGMAALSTSVPASPHGRNDATQTQNGKFGEAYASQGGLDNESNQTQTSGAFATATSKNVSNHYQFGNDNLATSTQTGYRNIENVLQEGNGNKSYGTQSAASILSTGNASVVIQQGNMNLSNVIQSN